MSFGSGSDTFTVKKFETQGEIEEKKRRRQENWEKVRKPDDPEECPEETSKSLFEQLEENKASQQKDFDDEFKIRNSVQGLEEEETKFLNFVSNRQLQLEKEREKEEKVVLEQMKEAAIKRATEKSPQPAADTKKVSPSTSSSSTAKKSQQSLLMGAIKRKSTDTASEDGSKRPRSESKPSTDTASEDGSKRARSESKPSTDTASEDGSKRPRSESEGSLTGGPMASPAEDSLLKMVDRSRPVAQVAGILPGIGSYGNVDSSDSDSSSVESEPEDYMQVKKVIRIHIHQN